MGTEWLTNSDKDYSNPPPGFPGRELMKSAKMWCAYRTKGGGGLPHVIIYKLRNTCTRITLKFWRGVRWCPQTRTEFSLSSIYCEINLKTTCKYHWTIDERWKSDYICKNIFALITVYLGMKIWHFLFRERGGGELRDIYVC